MLAFKLFDVIRDRIAITFKLKKKEIRISKEEMERELGFEKKEIGKEDKFRLHTPYTTSFTPLTPRASHPISQTQDSINLN